MATPRRTSTRRAVLSFERLKELTKASGAVWSDLLIEDYQGIIQDFVANADSIDTLEVRIIINEGDILDLQDSHYPNMATQVQFLQQQINGLPEFTIDTSGFTTDLTFITTDKVVA